MMTFHSVSFRIQIHLVYKQPNPEALIASSAMYPAEHLAAHAEAAQPAGMVNVAR